jgi:hypothetical protein
MKRVLCIALLSVVSASSIAHGEWSEPFLALGLAQDSCGAFLGAVADEQKARPPNAKPNMAYSHQYVGYVHFTNGFLTGASYADAGPRRSIGQATDTAGRMTWLENFCRSHPLAAYVSALVALRSYLESR